MEPIDVTTREVYLYTMLISIGLGVLVGFVPLVVGFVKRKRKPAFLGFILSIAGSAILGLILAIPVAAIFTWIIIKPSREAGTDAGEKSDVA